MDVCLRDYLIFAPVRAVDRLVDVLPLTVRTVGVSDERKVALCKLKSTECLKKSGLRESQS